MYTHGTIQQIHANGRIVYAGQVWQPYDCQKRSKLQRIAPAANAAMPAIAPFVGSYPSCAALDAW